MALLMAPFGRMAAAESSSHHPQSPIAHCDDMPQPADDAPEESVIDCMIACATLAAANTKSVEFVEAEPAPPEARIFPRVAGIKLTADPPPPRLS